MKTDYYELLGIESTASDTEIKKAYRKNALKYHPDKNPDKVEECTRIFAEIKAAYEVLSDPQERAFYDSHKNQILRQGSGVGGGSYGDEEDDESYVDEAGITANELLRFFDPVLYQRYDDTVAGFYRVAGSVFSALAAEEVSAGKLQNLQGYQFFNDDVEGYVGADLKYPIFGHSQSDYETVVRNFYAGWSNFSTVKSFFWRDNYRYSSTMDRRTRRAIEKTNKKTRDAAKKEYNETVRSFVAFIKKRDPRVKKGVEHLEKKRKEKQKADMERQLEIQRLEREKLRMNENFELQDWQKYDPEELAEVERNFSSPENGSDDDNGNDGDYNSDLDNNDGGFEDDASDYYECVVCNKVFKSDKQFKSHESSKKHKKEVNRLRWQMKKEGLALGLDDGLNDSFNDDDFLTADEEEEVNNVDSVEKHDAMEAKKNKPLSTNVDSSYDIGDDSSAAEEIIDNNIDEFGVSDTILPEPFETNNMNKNATSISKKKNKKQKKKKSNSNNNNNSNIKNNYNNNNSQNNSNLSRNDEDDEEDAELRKLSEAIEKGITLDSDDDDDWGSSSKGKKKKGKGRRKK